MYVAQLVILIFRINQDFGVVILNNILWNWNEN